MGQYPFFSVYEKYYSHSTLSHEVVQKSFTEFPCDRTRTKTILNPGRPNEITTPEVINKINYIVLNDSKVKVCEIVFISNERVVSILHTHFRMRKLSAR